MKFCSITRVRTHEHEHLKHRFCTQFAEKVFGQFTLADVSSTRRRPASEKCRFPNAM